MGYKKKLGVGVSDNLRGYPSLESGISEDSDNYIEYIGGSEMESLIALIFDIVLVYLTTTFQAILYIGININIYGI